MTKITAATRNAVRAILADSRDYDASTLRISREGIVTAKKDADKTFDGPETARVHIAHVNDMVDAHGLRREGW